MIQKTNKPTNNHEWILAIESSCDDSAIALIDIKNYKIILEHKISQVTYHDKYGGVMPSLASQLHTVNLPKLLVKFLDYLPNVKAIAVTNEPGLLVSLLEGVALAKSLSLALNLPLIAVNHLKGHIASIAFDKYDDFHCTALLLSGGHSQIIKCQGFDRMQIMASSMDDSIGECFDKVAKMLGLTYPGGPIIEQRAKQGYENAFKFPIPLQKDKNRLAFSYSGLKNAIRLKILAQKELTDKIINDICASFQKVAFSHIIDKLKLYLKKHHTKRIVVVGGVSANLYFRQMIVANFNDIKFEFAPLQYCTDNAAMIARAAVQSYEKQDFTELNKLQCYSTSNVL